MKIKYEIEAEGDRVVERVFVDGVAVAQSISARTEHGCSADGASIEDRLRGDFPEISEALECVTFLPLHFLGAIEE